MWRWRLFLVLSYIFCTQGISQSLDVNGALLLGANITLGNQNALLNISLKGFGTLNYGNAAMEAGATLYLNQIFRRHTVYTNGVGGGYEVFALGGIGDNDNLLGASIFQNSSTLIFDDQGRGGFKGFGFGFQRELLANELKAYTPRRGSLLLRFSNADYSVQLAFRNDFKFGKLLNGQATDYGATGSLLISYSKITSLNSAYFGGLGLDLFTPKPDYSKTPGNPMNSDDGRKNVWFVLPPYKDLFYSNLYGYGTYQDEFYALGGSLGINSQKLGAYIQNTLHDSFGLNPRYPWNVLAADKIFYELNGSLSTQLD